MTETPEQFIERVWAYTKKATKGPWRWVDDDEECATFNDWSDDLVPRGLPGGLVGDNCETVFDIQADSDEEADGQLIVYPIFGIDRPNAELIANSRTDLPAALSIIETLVAERDEARERVKHLQWVAGEARGWIARHDQFGGNIYEALISQLDRACEVDDAAVAAMKGVPSE